MKVMKMICICLFSFFILCGISSTVSASSLETDNLNFTLERVVEFGDNKYISINVENNSLTTYSFGWGNSCRLHIITTEGHYYKSISSGKIEQSSKTYSYMIKAPGQIRSVYYEDIIELKGSLPAHDSTGSDISATIDARVDDYSLIQGNTIIVLIFAFIAFLVILILVSIKKQKGMLVKKIGLTLLVLGIITSIYAGFCFIVKPVLGQADFSDVGRRYWFLLFLGMVIIVIGSLVRIKGIKLINSKYGKAHVPYNSNEHSNYQQRMFNEQHRAYMEQAQLDAQNFQDETNRQQQQQFNDFNNHNNGF